MNIHQKIAAVMDAVKYIQKDDNVEFKNTKYKALSEEKVTSLVREQLVKNGLVILPVGMTCSRHENITHVEVQYKIVNVDDPCDYEIVCSCGDGFDTQDKGSGKAMTYAYKYMLLRTFAIPTGEDPDKVSTDEIEDRLAKLKENTVVHEVVSCDRCGKFISDIVGKNGEMVTAETVAEIGRKQWNGNYCADCQKALREAKKKNGGN